MSLNASYFELIKCTEHNQSVFESYKAVYARSTMILFSRKTRRPLAALTLKADDVGCLSMLTGRPSPPSSSHPHFQGMLAMPDQPFTFTISNLSHEGMINFNVLHTPHRVSRVDPGKSYGINEVNELRPNESYTIQADQRSSCRMVLAGKTTTVLGPETATEKRVALTVKESEATNDDKPKGLYFYLSAVPDKVCKSLVGKYAEGTVWRVTPGFVRRLPKPQRPAMAPMEEYDYLFKVILLGDSGVGTTSLVTRFTGRTFESSGTFTHHIDFGCRIIQVEGKAIKAQVWDHGHCVLPDRVFSGAYCRGASGALIVYDTSRRSTFENAKHWLNVLRQNQHIDRHVQIMLVGNKSDLQYREVTTKEAMAFSEEHGLSFAETSSLSPSSVDAAFQRTLAESYRRMSRRAAVQPERAISLSSSARRGGAFGAFFLGRRMFQMQQPGGARPAMQQAPTRSLALQSTPPPFRPAASALFGSSRRSSNNRSRLGNAPLWGTQEREEAEAVIDVVAGARFAAPIDVGSTQAGELTYGHQVNVSSSYTGHEYAYEHASEPTVLSMSIWEGMKFLPLLCTIEDALAAEVKEWIENEGKTLIQSLNAIFKAETCLIDLESEADTIVCTCGHQCLNHANIGNLRHCPMCRSPISAFVLADGILLG